MTTTDDLKEDIEEYPDHPESYALAEVTALDAEAAASADRIDYVLALADDALMLAQRHGQLVAKGPEIEEDMALTNIGLDYLGQARALYQYAGRGLGKTEDDLAYFRDETEFRSAWLVEAENGDFAQIIARLLVFSVYQELLHRELAKSTDAYLAAVAAKTVKEVAYHVEHAILWTLRLGDGTDESQRRMREGLDVVWPYVGELFTNAPFDALIAAGVAVDVAALRPEFDARLQAVLTEATLDVPNVAEAMTRGRTGGHHSDMGFLLAEMQVLARQHPGATW